MPFGQFAVCLNRQGIFVQGLGQSRLLSKPRPSRVGWMLSRVLATRLVNVFLKLSPKMFHLAIIRSGCWQELDSLTFDCQGSYGT